jgi:hypothetical protein
MNALTEMIGAIPAEEPEDSEEEDEPSDDQPPPFEGRPHRAQAGDAAARSFYARYPGAARIQGEAPPDPLRDLRRHRRFDALNHAAQDRAIAKDAVKPARSFAERFPGAARIRSI